MGVNIDKPHKWKTDIRLSVNMYNDWFMNFAPEAFKKTRIKTMEEVIDTLSKTSYLKDISPEIIKRFPEILPTLRMSTCPPLAIDRLIGLSNVSSNLVKTIEAKKKLPNRMKLQYVTNDLNKICEVIKKLLDKDIFPWLPDQAKLNDEDVKRSSTIIADRLCGSITNPIIRNAQEKRQLNSIEKWLKANSYKKIEEKSEIAFNELIPGTFAYHYNIQVKLGTTNSFINMPIDVVIKPKNKNKKLLLIETKSAGDFTNVNKRRKEEAQKMSQIKETYANQQPRGRAARYVVLTRYLYSGLIPL
jgi:type II restriction enzyme